MLNQIHYVRLYGSKELSLMPQLEDLDVVFRLFSKVSLIHQTDISGYVILPEHIDLLLSPRQSTEDLSKFVQSFSRLYSRYFNDTYRRTGTIWHGRFRSSIIQGAERRSDALLYMEWLPELLKIQEAQTYPWSSYFHHAGFRNDYFMNPAKEYWNLGNTPFERQKHYREIFQMGHSQKSGIEIEKHLKMGWPWADRDFLIENQIAPERISPLRGRGRPRISKNQ